MSKDAFGKWLDLWQAKCDWPASPEAREAWNGAIDVVCDYVKNGFCENGFDDLNKMEKVSKKIQKRFKVKA